MLKVMTVDDSSTITRVYQNILPKIFKDDIELIQGNDGQEGLKLLSKNEDIRIIFLDINMPIMNGIDMLKKLRTNKEYNQIRVVMVTTEAEKKTVMATMKLGANGYIIKPFNIDVMRKSLQPILTRMNLGLNEKIGRVKTLFKFDKMVSKKGLFTMSCKKV